MDITFPSTITREDIVASSADGWTMQLTLAGGGEINGVIVTDQLLSDVELRFSYRDSTWKGKRACYALPTNARAVKLCQNITNRKTANESGAGKDIYTF